jgi:hypothetical protein
MKRSKRVKGLSLEFCERCVSVCDAACRSGTLRERTREKALLERGRVL